MRAMVGFEAEFMRGEVSLKRKQEIRHISGATSVETKFQVTFRVEAERVWLKLEKRHPVKFAIWDGLYTDEIIEISLERLSS